MIGIRLGIITLFENHLFGMAAGLITPECQTQSSVSVGIGHKILLIISEGSGGHRTCDDRSAAVILTKIRGSLHSLDICHEAAHAPGREFCVQPQDRLKENIFCHHQTLTDGSVCRLSEIPSGGMLFRCSSADHGDLNICDFRSCQNARKRLLLQMRQDKALPVESQIIGAAVGFQNQPASRLAGFHQKVHLCIMPQRLVMTHALDGIRYGLFVHDRRLCEINPHVKPLCTELFQNFHLDLSHDAGRNLTGCVILVNVKKRLFLFKNPKIPESFGSVLVRRKKDAALPYRLENGCI